MTVVMVEISIKKMENNRFNSFNIEIFISPCVNKLTISNMFKEFTYIYSYVWADDFCNGRND